jgi:hypothetical protein
MALWLFIQNIVIMVAMALILDLSVPLMVGLGFAGNVVQTAILLWIGKTRQHPGGW